jgi:AraC-like DNA-binding protein
MRLEELGELARLVLQSPTIGTAIETLIRSASRHSSGERWWLEQRGDDVGLHRSCTAALRRGRAQMNDCALILTIRLLRLGAGPEWRFSEIHLDSARPGHAGELEALARRGARFDQSTTLVVFPRRVLSLPLPTHRAIEPHSREAPPSPDFEGSVRQMVVALLRLGVLELRVAADAAGMSVRSFQRRLAETGLSFARLAAEARLAAAHRMLCNPDRKVIGVSAELGYTDSANFTRAFRRWAGVPPQEYRSRVTAGSSRASLLLR